MSFTNNRFTLLTFGAFALLLCAMGAAALHLSVETMFVVSVLMFVTCVSSAVHLYGVRMGLRLMVLAVSIGFFAEYMGENYGWFFGDYDFTDGLGLRLLGVPVVIPLMWFNLVHMCLVIGNIILFRTPVAPAGGVGTIIASSVFCGMLVTAYDLGADPYMVFVAKAWIMTKTDGYWFGETLQGFVGWMSISTVIAALFNLLTRSAPPPAGAEPFRKVHALVPVLIYADLMVFLMMHGEPVETRTIVLFAMGIPLLAALLTYQQWSFRPNAASD